MNDSQRTVKLGITRLLETERHILRGTRVGLIANSASIDEQGIPTKSLLLDAGINLTCLFSPEHGYDISAAAGQRVPSSTDPDTGFPIRSLYHHTRQPNEEMVRDIDAFVFDLQDIGVRCYTYIWTMALAMQSAALFGKLFVVLDRPNPLGGVIVQGPVLDGRFAGFLGMYPIPLRHGMTVGELALMFNNSFEIGANLAVIRMQGWRRRLWFAETGLTWRPPSPAIRTPECALLYSGTCLFEGTNISEGRGTSSPFCLIGAPWLDPGIVKEIDSTWLAGFAVSPQRFTPTGSKHEGKECFGFAVNVIDRELADPLALVVALLLKIASRYGTELRWNETHFDSLAGTDALRREICAGSEPEKIFEEWKEPHREFEKLRLQHLLYEG